MNAFELLYPASWAVIILAALTVLIPYIRRKSDLLTSWNFFLMGTISFVGLSGVEAYWRSDWFRVLDYTNADYEHYLWGLFTFYATLYLGYYWIKVPRRIADRFPRKWPPATTAVLFFTLPLTMIMAVGAMYPPQIPIVHQFFVQVGNKAIVFSLVLAFVAWYGQKVNPVLLLTLIIVVGFGAMFSIMQGGGRRTLINVFLAIPLCLYWLTLRYKSPWLNLAITTAVGIVAIIGVAAYSHVRHFDRQGRQVARDFANTMEALRRLPNHLTDIDFEIFSGQHAVQFSLATIHLYTTTGEREPDPFNSLKFLLTNPIPREFWEDKPMPLGYTLPRDVRAKTTANWGPGIVGHGFHEGGLHMLALYSVLFGMFLRYFDELLVRQPGNPYLLAGLAAMASHIFGWTRGDIGTFNIQIVGSCILVLILSWIGRILFGTGIVYPRTGTYSTVEVAQPVYPPYAAPSA